ncbi:MAG: hypothetical protein M3O34_01410, partial [Chloroflexota bacterium]|nr:hypothetical protein [Chloroflexota bacterium]
MHDHGSHDDHRAAHQHGVTGPPPGSRPADAVAEELGATAVHAHPEMTHDAHAGHGRDAEHAGRDSHAGHGGAQHGPGDAHAGH